MATRLTGSGVTGAGQSEESFLLQSDAATNQEGGQQRQRQAQPQLVGGAGWRAWRQTFSVLASVCVCSIGHTPHQSGKHVSLWTSIPLEHLRTPAGEAPPRRKEAELHLTSDLSSSD